MRISFTCAFIFSSAALFGQFGGSYTYAYLNLPPSARISSLGGLNITTFDEDLNLGYQNPAILNPSMDGRVSFSHAIEAGNINYGYAAYGKYLSRWKLSSEAGILYRSYGNFTMTDDAGNRIGSFKAGEFALNGGVSYSENKLSYGMNLRILYASLESYNSLGWAADLGASYIDTAKQFCTSFVLRNIGGQIKPYTAQDHEALPFQADFGISKRLAHLPLRLSFTLHDLQTFDIRYDDPNAEILTNIFSADSTQATKTYFADKAFRHLIVGGEFYFGKNFNVRIGYDHMMREELRGDLRGGLAGFALGFGMHINRFSVDYAHRFFSLAGGSNEISLAVNLHDFIHRSTVSPPQSSF